MTMRATALAATLLLAAGANAAIITSSASAPVAGPNDILQTASDGTAVGWAGDPINYYTDNGGHAVGQSFTTGASAGGYKLGAIGTLVADRGSGADNLDVVIYSVSGATATVVATETGRLPGGTTGGNWITFTLATPIALAANTQYAYTIHNSSGQSGYMGLGIARSDAYAGGTALEVNTSDGSFAIPSVSGTSWDGAFYAQLASVPEPGTLGLLVASGILALRRRRA